MPLKSSTAIAPYAALRAIALALLHTDHPDCTAQKPQALFNRRSPALEPIAQIAESQCDRLRQLV